MDDGDGSFIVELQAKKIADILASGNAAHKCPQCEIIMNPVEFMYSQYGLCSTCAEDRRRNRVKGKMV